MNIEKTGIEGLLLITPSTFPDLRGDFFEAWNRDRYAEAGIPSDFAQDNVTRSRGGVLRGLHVQRPPFSQGKLITVLDGSILDVVVDLRPGSPSFGRAASFPLSAETAGQLWIPAGFAHGFQVTSGAAVVHYKCTAPHVPSHELAIAWNDATLAIHWPVPEPILSGRDAAAPPLDVALARLSAID